MRNFSSINTQSATATKKAIGHATYTSEMAVHADNVVHANDIDRPKKFTNGLKWMVVMLLFALGFSNRSFAATTLTLSTPTAVGSASVCAGAVNVPIYRFTLTCALTSPFTGNLTGVTFATTGSVVPADIVQYKLWSGSVGGTLLATSATAAFSSFSSTVVVGTPVSYFITADIAAPGTATNGHTISVSPMGVGNFTTSGASRATSGTILTGGIQTIVSPSISGSSSVCVGANTTLTGAPASGAWASVTTSVATITTPAGVVHGVTAGTSTISYTFSGCTTTSVETVIAAPTSLSASLSASPLCVGNNLTLNGAATGAVTTLWTGPGGTAITSPGSLTASVTGVALGNAGAYTLTATNSCGTSSVTTTALSVVATAPTSVTATVNPTSACPGTNVTLNGGATGAVSFAWTGPGGTGIASPGSLSTGITGVVAANNGVYTLTATNVCGPTIGTTSLTILAAPTGVSASATPNPVCLGNTLSLNGAATGASLFTWTGPGGTAITSPGTISASVVSVASGNAGIYTLVTSNGTCSTTATTSSVTVNTPLSGYSASATPNPVCLGQVLSLNGVAPGATNFAWTGPGGTGITSPSTISASVNGVAAGNAGVYTLTASIAGCPTVTAVTSAVTINALPSISGSALACVGLNTSLSGTPSGGTWLSVTTSVATIDGTGLLHGVAAGTSTISYTNTLGCVITRVETVNSIPASPTITPSATSICNGGSSTLTTAAATTWSPITDLYTDAGFTTPYAGTAVTTVYYHPATISVTTTNVITATVTSGVCTNSANTTITIHAQPTPISGGTSIMCSGTTTTLTEAFTDGAWGSANTAVATVNSSGLVSAIASGTSTISYSNGCGSAPSVVITVQATPAVVATPSSAVNCSGAGVTSTASGAATYVWSPAGTGSTTDAVFAANPLSNTVYTVVGTSGVCSNTATFSVTNATNPTIAVAPSPLNRCSLSPGDLLTASGAVSYSWLPTTGLTNASIATPSVTVTTSIVYTVTGTSAAGCTGTNTVTVNVTPSPIITMSSTASACGGATSANLGYSGTAGSPDHYSIAYSSAAHTAGFADVSSTVLPASPIVLTVPGAAPLGLYAGTVTVTSATSSCSSTNNISVSVSTGVTPAAISSANSTCPSASTLTLSDATGGGTWSTNNAFIATVGSSGSPVTLTSGVSSGTVVVTYTTGCGSPGFVTKTVTVNTFASCEVTCNNTYSSGCTGNDITNVTFAGINNPTGCTNTPGNTYTSPFASVAQGSSYSLSVNYTVTGVILVQGFVSAWIDFDHSGTFDASEYLAVGNGVGAGFPTATLNSTATNSFAIPANAVSGMTKMRIRVTNTDPTSTGACTNMAKGETEDYYVNISCNTPAVTGTQYACYDGGTTLYADPTSGGTWTSSNTNVATVAATGTISGVATGTSTISYLLASQGCFATRDVNILSAPLPISGLNAVCAGSTITLSDILPGGTWDNGGSTNSSVDYLGNVTGVTAGTTIITYTACSAPVNKTIVVNALPTISGAANLCTAGPTSVTLSGAPTGGTWTSSNTGAATVNSSGVVTAVGAGTANITYTGTNTCVTSVSETVGNVLPVVGTSVSPSSICSGGTSTITATAGAVPSYLEGSITYATVPFSPTGTFNSATTPVSGSNDDGYYAVSLPFNFTYFGTNYSAGSNVYISTNGTISLGTPVSGFDNSSLPTATFPYDLISVLGINLDLSTGGGGTITYGTTGVSPNRKFVISYNAERDYLFGFPLGAQETGQVVLDESTGNIDLNMTTVSTTNHTLGIQKAGGTTAIVVPGQNGSTTAISNLSYRFSPTTVNYTWSPSTFLVDNTGSSVIADAITSTTIYTVTAAYGGCTSTASATVLLNPDPVAISGGTSAFCAGATTTLSDAVTGGTWSTSDPTIAAVSLSSNPTTVTGVAGGTATITYTNVCGLTVTTVVTVNSSVISGIPDVCVGSDITLTGAPSGGTWTSVTGAVATVGLATGTVHGVSVGTSTISYFGTNGCNTAVVAAVNNTSPGPISGAGSLFCETTSITLSDATAGGLWLSDNTSVATVGSTTTTVGTVTGVSGGTATITYTNGCGTAPTMIVSVNPGPAAITGYSAVCVGQSITLSESVGGVSWTSSTTSAATVTSSGVVTGVSPGSTTITVTLPSTGCFVTKPITVNFNSILPTATAIATPASICPGFSSALTAGGAPSAAVISVPFNYVSVATASGVTTDNNSVGVAMPFSVNLFGTSYSTAYICANGFVSFNSATTTTNFTAVSLPSANAPRTAAPQAMVAAFWHDLNPALGGNITYGTIGSTPNRKFVVSWNGVWDKSPTAPQGTNTGEIIFYEGQTYVDVMVTTTGNGGNPYNMTCGMQNAAGTIGINAPGENGVHYTANSQGWRFYIPSYDYLWSPATFLSATTGAHPFVDLPTATTTYSVNVTDVVSGCQSVASATVTLNPLPTTAATANVACVGGTLNLNANATGADTYSWNGPAGFTSSSATPVLTGVTTAMGGTYSVTVTNPSGCMASSTVVVTVNTLAIAAANDGPACVGGTVNLTSTPSGTAVPTGYAWSGPSTYGSSIQSPTLTISATTDMTGTYTVTVTASGSGCTASNTTNVTINTLATAPSNDGPACEGSTVNLFSNITGTAVPTSYSWSGPSFTAGTVNTSLSSVTTAMTGTYNFTVTATGSGCVATGSTNVTVNNLGVTANNDAPACVGGTVNLTAIPSGSEVPTNYNWTGPNSFSSTNQNPVISGVTTAMSGTYTVTTSGAGTGCSATSTTTVTINTLSITATNDGPACVGGTVNLTSTPSGTAVPTGYAWSGPSVYGSSIQSPTLTTSATTDMTGIYTVTVTANGSGCTASNTTNVTINTLATGPSNDGPACEGSTVNLFSNITGTAVPTSYSWSGPSFTAGTVNTSLSSVTTAMTGTYNFTVTATGSGCVATGSTNVTVNNLGVTANNDAPACVGGTVNLTAIPSGSEVPTNYNWTGPNSFSSTNQNPVITGATLFAAGTYTVVMSGTGTGCTTTSTTTVVINTIGITASNDGPACVGGTVNLTSTPSGTAVPTGYAWSGPSSYGSSIESPTLTTSATTDMTGIYTVTVMAIGSNCSATTTTNVVINDLGITATNDGPACLNAVVILTSTPSGSAVPTSYSWSGPASFTNTNQNTSVAPVAFENAGVYTVTVNASGSACTATATTNVVIRSLSINAFNDAPTCAGLITNLTSVPGGTSVPTGYTWSGPLSFSATTQNTMLDPAAVGMTGTYTVTVTAVGTGCIASATTDVLILPVPLPISGNPEMCVGATSTLSDASPGGIWTSTNTGIATIGTAGAPTSPHLVSGLFAGTVAISYTSGDGCASVAVVTVDPNPNIDGMAPVCLGATVSLSGNIPGGLWSASNTHASVGSSSGIITGVTIGTDVITYTLPTTCRTTAIATVNAAPTGIGGIARVCQGQTTTLNETTGGGHWSSSNPSVATVGSSGSPVTVTGVLAGSAVISYILPSGCYSTVVVTVNSLAPITGNMPVCEGATITLSDLALGGTWASGTLAKATVGSISGVVTGISGGTVRISYTTFSGCLALVTVTVNPGGTILGTASVCEGATTSLSDATTGGTWISSSPSNAGIGSGSGLVSGVAAGTTTISYVVTATGCTSTRDVTVNAAPAAITGTSIMCAGTSNSLSDATLGGLWTSTSPGIATVGSTSGVVTGVVGGTSRITYKITAGGCYATQVVTINTTPGAITGNVPVCQSATILLHDGTAGGSWSSSTPSVALISSTGTVTGAGGGTSTITYAMATGCQNTTVVTVNPITPITGSTPMCVGASVALTDATSGGNWSSSNPARGTVDASGNVTGIAAGTVNITYLMPTGCKSVTVATVNALPAAITGTKTMCDGGSPVVLHDATTGGSWYSASGSGNATVDGSGDVTGTAVGTATISYAANGCGITTTVTVNAAPTPLTGNTPVCAGSTLSLGEIVSGGTWSSSAPAKGSVNTSGVVTAIAGGTTTISYTTGSGCSTSVVVTVNAILPITGSSTLCFGSTTNLIDGTPGGTWSSSDPGTASVGTSGIVSGIAIGSATIFYTTSSCVRSLNVTVNPIPSAIAGTLTVCNGATTTLSDDGSGTWSSNNTPVATISAAGVVTGASAGTATIKYTAGTGCFASAVVTVNAGPSSIIGAASVCVGATTQLSDLLGGGAWSTGSTFASVDAVSGVVTGLVSGGTATITYTAAGTGCYMTRNLVVNAAPAPVSGNPIVCLGGTTFVSDATAGGVSWTSSNTSVATVSGSGAVQGISLGTANVTYLISSGCTAEMTITVTSMPSAITGNSPLCVGNMISLTDASAGGTWASSNGSIATVGTDGTVTGTGGGSATINYIISGTGGCYASAIVTVSAATPITGASVVCTGSSITLNNSTTGGSWSSSAPGTASVDPSLGTVTAVSNGTAVISYTFAGGGCSVTKIVTVNTTPTAINGLGLLCVGTQLALTDDVTGGAWTSSNTGVASAGGSTGVVTGMAAGTSRITYNLSGCSVSAVVTVNPAYAVTGFTSICVGGLAAMHNSAGGGTWSSSNPGVGTISTSGVLTGLTAGTTTVSYAVSSGCVTTATVTVNPIPDAITGNGPVCVGGTLNLSDDIAGGTWHSSDGVVNVDGSGDVSAIATGTATITYTSAAGCATTTVVTVGSTPAAIGGSLTVCAGATTTLFDATLGGTWTSTTLSATIDGTSGVVTGVAAGTTTISYTLAGCGSITADVTVNASPAAISGGGAVCVGGNISLTDATGGGTWSTTSSLATVDGSGNVSGLGAGTVTITFVAGGCSATTVVTVTGIPVAITAPPFICLGSTIVLYDATPGGLWSSSDATITIGTGTGVVTGVGIGTASITYSVGTACSATTVISVNVATTPIFGATDVCIGTSTLYTDATFGGGWSSSNNAVATVGTDGSVGGVAVGTATISYNTAGCISTQIVSVDPAPGVITGPGSVCENLTITLGDATGGGIWSTTSTFISLDGSGNVHGLVSGVATVTYTSDAGCFVTRDININPAPTPVLGMLTVCAGASTFLSDATSGGISWSSSNTSVATISGSGAVAAGSSPGTTTVTYTITTGCYTTAVVTVNALPAVITNNSAICQGSSIVLSDASAGGAWASGNGAVASIGTDGTLLGVSGGTATISYFEYGSGCRAQIVATVNATSPVNGSHPLCAGSTITLTDATSGGTWSSDNIAVGTINGSGVVTGTGVGTAHITYTTAAGCTSVTIITVNGTPTAISGPTAVCVGSVIALTDATGGGVWSSTGNLSVDGSGDVTGVTAGTAIITYGAGAGCSATAVITVNATPTAILGAASVCAGLTTSLSNATIGGTWSSSASGTAAINATTGVVTGVAAGTVTISYTKVGTGCAVAEVVTVNALPSAINGLGVICAGSGALLTDATGGGTWSSGTTSVATIGTDGTVTGVAGGTSRITYTTAAGCVSTGVMTVSAISPITGTPSACIGFTTLLADASGGGTWSSTNTSIATVGSSSGLVTALAAGTTTIVYTIPSGCSRSVVVTVSSSLAPITGTPAVCITATTLLSDASAGGVWSSSNASIASVGATTGSVSGLVAGTSKITYTVGGSCATYVVVTVNPQPSGISGPATVCLGSTLALSDATSGGDWASAGNVSAATTGTTTTVVTPISLGTGTVTYTLLSTGCRVAKTITVNNVPGPVLGTLSVCGLGSVTFLSDASTGTSWAISPVGTATVSGSGRVYGVSTGTATVSFINSAGCMANAVVTVNSLVTAAPIFGANNVSSGATITLSDATAGGNWSSSNVSVAGVDGVGDVTGIAASGTATITYTVPYGSGCNAIATKTITVHTPAPHPHGTGVGGTTTVFTGAVVDIADETAGGIWNSSNTTVASVDGTGIVTGVSPGSANITHIITYSDGETSTTVTPIVVSGAVADIRVMPNPNNGTFSVKGSLGSLKDEEVTLEVTDVLGQIVYKSKIIAPGGKINEKVSLNNTYANGMYLLTVTSGSENKLFHFVIEK